MNNFISIQAPAKVNLNLFVKCISSNGLHFLKSHVCFLELTDHIHIRNEMQDTFCQTSKNKLLLLDSNNNLIVKTINMFRNYTNWNQNFKVILDKKIPIGAGLGGGSADAAATLILLRKLYNAKKKSNQKVKQASLYEIAIKLGSDVPACLKSRDLIINGFGEKLISCKIPSNYYFLIINPNIQLSTEEVFTRYKQNTLNKEDNFNTDFENIKIFNSLLSSSISLVPQISFILSELKNTTNIVSCGMTGSGSTCFGIFRNPQDIKSFLVKFSEITKKPFYIWYGRKKNYNFNRITNSKVLEKNL